MPTIDQKYQAKLLYFQGFRPAEIARTLGLEQHTIYSWKARERWGDTPTARRVETCQEARYIQLVNKSEKVKADYEEMDFLMRQMERSARIRRYEDGGTEADLNPKVNNRNQGRKKKSVKNAIPPESVERFREAFFDKLFDYQRRWWGEKELGRRIRNILKSRQIGATYYFAREAFYDALLTGKNKIFLSASKAQAHVFKQYIVAFAREVADIELKGDPIGLPNGANLYFLGTNARTAQSYHGDVYMDEYFWIPKFQEFRKVASGMAMHKKWSLTYFSTPSTTSHEAFPFWSGDLFNRRKPKEKRIELDVSPKALAGGRLDPDGQWRQVVTIEDAVAAGCDLFDLDQLRVEYSEEECANLLMCEFMDDTLSTFSLAMLQPCMCDSWVEWADFNPLAARPAADRPVWIGYDPSRTRDAAAVVIVEPPRKPDGRYRVLDKIVWHNLDFIKQAERIRQLTQAYTVTHLEVDCTGPGGLAVLDLVKAFYPGVRGAMYSPQSKSTMIAKALNIISNKRLQYDTGWRDLTGALMSIRKTVTPNGQITFFSGRSEELSHGDVAWALLHALNKSEITAGGDPGRRNIVELS